MDAIQSDLLRDGTRVRILDAATEGATAAELAVAVGIPVTRVYHHVDKPSTVPSSWTEKGGTVTAPASAAYGRVHILLYTASGWLNVDDVSVTSTAGISETIYYKFAGDIVGMRTGGELHWMFTDHLGSIATTYKADGTEDPVRQYYYPWGNLRGSSEPVVPTDVGYTGQTLDTSTDLMFYNARYYDPAIRRFISADTIVPDPANPQDLNRYSYVQNNPILYNDPSGHCSWDPNCGIVAEDTSGIGGSLSESAANPASGASFGEVVGALAGLATDMAESVAGAADVAWDRAWEFGEFQVDRISDRAEVLYNDPGQALFDTVTLDWLAEDVGGLYGTMVLGGNTDLADCPDSATCVKGAQGLAFGGQTFGHAILFRDENPTSSLVAHEMRHVKDIGRVGWLPMALHYGFDWLTNGHDYKAIYYESRANSEQNGNPPPEIDSIWTDLVDVFRGW